MTALAAAPSVTFLTHYFGSGLADEKYLVERYRSLVDGDIRRIRSRDEKDAVVTRRAVKAIRPARNEIVIATGVKKKGGIQVWGDLATGLFADRRQKRL